MMFIHFLLILRFFLGNIIICNDNILHVLDYDLKLAKSVWSNFSHIDGISRPETITNNKKNVT